jgi:hypothetical protein
LCNKRQILSNQNLNVYNKFFWDVRINQKGVISENTHIFISTAVIISNITSTIYPLQKCNIGNTGGKRRAYLVQTLGKYFFLVVLFYILWFPVSVSRFVIPF